MGTLLLGNVKSKTSWVAALLTIFGLFYDNWDQVAQLIPPQYVGRVFTGLGIVMWILRNLTNCSISEKGASSSVVTTGSFKE